MSEVFQYFSSICEKRKTVLTDRQESDLIGVPFLFLACMKSQKQHFRPNFGSDRNGNILVRRVLLTSENETWIAQVS